VSTKLIPGKDSSNFQQVLFISALLSEDTPDLTRSYRIERLGITVTGFLKARHISVARQQC